MSRKIVIVGGVALGPKVACRARRLDPDAEIILVDRDEHISYGGCGIPYYVGGDVPDLEGLMSTAYHMKRDVGFFKTVKRVDVRTRTEATSIDRTKKCLEVTELDNGNTYCLNYDYLVLATGSQPFAPPIPGKELDGVMAVANLHHAEWIKGQVQKGQVESAVVVGAGAIGLEMAEALADLWGVEVTVVEFAPHVLPQALGPEMAQLVQDAFGRSDVPILTGRRVTSINGKTSVESVTLDDGRELPCQLVVLATGARPNADLAREAGLAIGPLGGILVDSRLRTSDYAIYAGGDCIEMPHAVSGNTTYLPLGSMANRQGRVIGTNIAGQSCGCRATFPAAVGSFCMKAFDLGTARAGLTEAQARAAGFTPAAAIVAMTDRAHFYPTRQMTFMKLIADAKNRKVLGVEAVGNGDAVKGRVDAIAVAMGYGALLEDISNLEVAYSPPYAQAMDIVNAAANTLENILEGRNEVLTAQDFLAGFEAGEFKVLDVRDAKEAEPYAKKYPGRWVNIPGEELANRLDQVPAGEPLVLFCNSGQRSYEAQLLLRSKGLPAPRNVQGGHLVLSATDRGFLAEEE